MLRGRLILGISSPSIQKSLLNETDQSFEATFRKATALESTMKEMKDMNKPNGAGAENSGEAATPGTVNRFQRQVKTRQADRKGNTVQGSQNSQGKAQARDQRGPKKKCYRSNNGYHNPSTCWHKKAKCNHCKRQGHIEQACRVRQGEAHRIDDVTEDVSDGGEYEFDVLHLQDNRKKIEPYIVAMNVNGVNLDMELDTGASSSLISMKTYKEKFSNIPYVIQAKF